VIDAEILDGKNVSAVLARSLVQMMPNEVAKDFERIVDPVTGFTGTATLAVKDVAGAAQEDRFGILLPGSPCLVSCHRSVPRQVGANQLIRPFLSQG
jgi:hypothetical protein